MIDLKLKKNEDLKNHCTFQTGGKADYFYELENADKLPKLLTFAKQKKIPYLIIGKGSNILFDDKGFRGLVIKNLTEKITFKKDNKVIADSGVLMAKLVQECVKKGLSPLEKWIGLPGTVGGAVYGNAGCNGLETKDILETATLLNSKTGKIKEVTAKYLQFKYRTSKLKKSDEIVLNATFKLSKSLLSSEEQKKITGQLSKSRLQKQPLGLSSGSFFKNPSTKHPAGMLIDKAGLKGKTIGKAQISEKHGNFLLNLGGANSADITKLAKLAKRLVKAKFNTTLTPEVKILTEKGTLKSI
ncbi:MAG: UDP-N-acetylmuramate dehydrogenase [Candidatus Gracilibacteria bacterium]|nr:UDP-N-acetylmuramate dehydrogenase [Candidatus Gracilibacteria bacterium]